MNGAYSVRRGASSTLAVTIKALAFIGRGFFVSIGYVLIRNSAPFPLILLPIETE